MPKKRANHLTDNGHSTATIPLTYFELPSRSPFAQSLPKVVRMRDNKYFFDS